MLIRYPQYYKAFHCLAGACPDTCCAGWEITADKQTRRKYKLLAGKSGRLKEKLSRCGKNRSLCAAGERCGFLNRDGLCDICLEFGEHALCRTCRAYPRHMEDYGELREMVLLLSCPEAARLVLEHGSDGYYVRRKKREADREGIDGKFLSELLDTRAVLWKIAADSWLPVDIRLVMALSLAHDVQRRLNGNRREEISKILERYRRKGAAARFCDRIGLEEKGDRFLLMSDFMELLAELPAVGSGWPEMLEACRKDLYHSKDSRKRYAVEREQFLAENQELELHWERIFEYFIYSFFMAALYDRDLYSKVKMAVFCCLAIEELDFAAWRKDLKATGVMRFSGDICGAILNGVSGKADLWLERQVEICHLFARQVENSDENRRMVEERLKSGRFGVNAAAASLGSSPYAALRVGTDDKQDHGPADRT